MASNSSRTKQAEIWDTQEHQYNIQCIWGILCLESQYIGYMYVSACLAKVILTFKSNLIWFYMESGQVERQLRAMCLSFVHSDIVSCGWAQI